MNVSVHAQDLLCGRVGGRSGSEGVEGGGRGAWGSCIKKSENLESSLSC